MIIHIYDDDLLNGDGIREVVFLQGCHHHCKGCFNQETWEFKKPTPESELKDSEYLKHLDDKLSQDYIDGVTISGGDPLAPENLYLIRIIIDIAKRHEKTIWIYSGYTYEHLSMVAYDILKDIDVLCDGKFVEELKSPNKPWVGSSNQRVIDVQKSLKSGTILLK